MVSHKKNKDVSVVIPTFNRCVLLKRALDSVFKQTVFPSEVLVIDNGSTDETYQMITSNFPCVKYIKEDKKGVSASRNKGIFYSKSSWIAFLDSDDVWRPKN